jgi:hypothetical protein
VKSDVGHAARLNGEECILARIWHWEIVDQCCLRYWRILLHQWNLIAMMSVCC